MTKRQKYFMKQKLIGLGTIVVSIILSLVLKGEAIILPIVCVPTGLILLFSKEMYWCDDYYYEILEQEKERL